MWKDILKNQVALTGLNMRSMDLDNIIEEEEDDSCRKRIVNFIEKMKNYTGTNELKIEVVESINPPHFPDIVPEEVLCYLLEELLYFGDNSGWKKLGEAEDEDALYEYEFGYRGLQFNAFKSPPIIGTGEIFMGLIIQYKDSGIHIDVKHYNEAFYDFIQKNL